MCIRDRYWYLRWLVSMGSVHHTWSTQTWTRVGRRKCPIETFRSKRGIRLGKPTSRSCGVCGGRIHLSTICGCRRIGYWHCSDRTERFAATMTTLGLSNHTTTFRLTPLIQPCIFLFQHRRHVETTFLPPKTAKTEEHQRLWDCILKQVLIDANLKHLCMLCLITERL